MSPSTQRTMRMRLMDGTRHAGYTVSLQRRNRVEEVFGWLKTIGYVTQSETLWRAAGQLAVHLHYGRLEPGADA